MKSLSCQNSPKKLETIFNVPLQNRLLKLQTLHKLNKFIPNANNESHSNSITNYSEMISSRSNPHYLLSNKNEKQSPQISQGPLPSPTLKIKRVKTTKFGHNSFPHSFSSSILKGNNENNKKTNLPKLYQNYLKIEDKISKKEKSFMFKVNKNKIPNKKLQELYNMNTKYVIKEYQIKKNNKIAYQDDFNVNDYQLMLLGFTSMTTRRELVLKMKEKLNDLNNNSRVGNSHSRYNPKSRWENLITNIENNVPLFLIDKFKSLGKRKKNVVVKSKKEKTNVS